MRRPGEPSSSCRLRTTPRRGRLNNDLSAGVLISFAKHISWELLAECDCMRRGAGLYRSWCRRGADAGRSQAGLESQRDLKWAFLYAQVVQVYPALMSGEVLIQDAASLAARGEELTYWALQARVHSVRQTLLGAPPHACSIGTKRLCQQPGLCLGKADASAPRFLACRFTMAPGVRKLVIKLGTSMVKLLGHGLKHQCQSVSAGLTQGELDRNWQSAVSVTTTCAASPWSCTSNDMLVGAAPRRLVPDPGRHRPAAGAGAEPRGRRLALHAARLERRRRPHQARLPGRSAFARRGAAARRRGGGWRAAAGALQGVGSAGGVMNAPPRAQRRCSWPPACWR